MAEPRNRNRSPEEKWLAEQDPAPKTRFLREKMVSKERG